MTSWSALIPQNGALIPKTITLSQFLVAASNDSGVESKALFSLTSLPAKYTSGESFIFARLASHANLTNSSDKWSGYHIKLVCVSNNMLVDLVAVAVPDDRPVVRVHKQPGNRRG